jgi:gliding motility-associated-like protein
MRLGNEETGYSAEMIRYAIHVPAGFNNYSFNFKYAVVFQNPTGHPASQKPRFTVTGYDSATGLPIPCATQTFVASDSLRAFFNSTTVNGEEVLYLPWTAGNLNLSGMGGKTVIVEVVTEDCGAGGHFGYGYFDVISCGKFNATIASCDLKSGNVTLSGPPGYKNYEWWDQNFTTRLNPAPYRTQTVTVPVPPTCQYFNLVLTPFDQNGCPDTIRTSTFCDFTINASPDSVCNTLGKPIQLSTTLNAPGGGIFTYQWTGDTTLSSYTIPNPIASPLSSGYYVVTVTDTNNCFRQDTVIVENPGFHANLGPDLVTCLGTPVTMNPVVTPVGAPGYVFTWIPGAGLSDSTILKPVYTPSAVGSEQFVLRVDSGICATSDTFSIRTLPNTFTVTDTAVCEFDSVLLHADGVPEFTYNWSYTGPAPGFGRRIVNFVPPATNGPQAGFRADTTRTFTVTASYPTCPDMVHSFTVRVEPRPRVNITEPIIYKCMTHPAYVTAHVNPFWFNQYSYHWAINDYLDKLDQPIVRYTGDMDTMLYVLVTTPLGCAGIDSVRIKVYPNKFASLAPIDPDICPRDTVLFTASGASTYRWEPPLYLSDTASAVVTSKPVTTTSYTLYATDTHGCVDTLYTTVTVNPEATISLPDTVVLYPGQSYQLNPLGNLLYYSWFPTLGLSPSASVSNPVASPTVNTRYYVSGTTEAGCKASDSIYVLVHQESAIAMPNAFSPGSEPNPVFKVLHMGAATLKSFRIYNRWGVKMFETSDINKGWDGTFNGEPQPMGVYVYTVEAVSNTGKPFVNQGNVTLVR